MTTTPESTPLRVVVTCDWFVKYCADQTAALARAGAEVVLLCRDHTFEFGGDADERLRTLDKATRDGVTVVELPGRGRDLRAARALLGLRRQMAAFAPHVIHAHQYADPRALLVLPRVPLVLTLHDPTPHPGQPVARNRAKRLALAAVARAWRARARVIVVHSRRLLPRVDLRHSQRGAVIPLGLTVHPAPLAVPPAPLVGFFGRLEPYKGLGTLAEAMPHVWSERPDVHLRVAGHGPTAFTLQDPRVQVDGRYLPESELEAFFAATSLAVLPYTEASQTAAGNEALGYGIPLVVSRAGGLVDLALDDSYLVEPGDARGLAAAIVAHIDDGPEVRARVHAELARPRSWDAAAALSLTLYEELVDR
jgi:glycosyltransferase involved in cell wall biosynthesis